MTIRSRRVTMEPNAVVNGVPGISLRDEDWDVAQSLIREAWEAGYHGMHFDDGLLMFKEYRQSIRLLESDSNAQTYTDLKDVEMALSTAKEVWWL